MKDLVNPIEMYLRTIHDLDEDGVPARQVRLVEHLHHSSATVCQTVSRMRRSGLVTTAPDHVVELTERGRDIAIAVTRKHRLAERLLTDIVDMPAVLAHAEACRLEHVMSEAVERRIVAILDHPTTSPWGNPIPGLDRLGISVEPASATTRLADIPMTGGPVTGTVRCISELAQADPELIGALVGAGIIPGARVTVTPRDGSYAIRGLDTVTLTTALAHVVRIDRD